MFYLLKTIMLVLKEAVFDNKDEYNFKSPKFNSRKVMIFLVLLMSIFINAFMVDRFYKTATLLIKAQEELKGKCAPTATETPHKKSQGTDIK